MSSRAALLAVLLVLAVAQPGLGGSAVIGSVAGTMNATIGAQVLLPNTTVFSGDSLEVSDGVAVVAVGKSSRVVFGRQTAASFLRENEGVTVVLSRGSLSVYHPEEAMGLRVRIGEVSVVAAKGFKTLGQVAMAGGAIVVTAKEGLLQVEGSGPAIDVRKGSTIVVATRASRAAAPSPAGALGGTSWLTWGSFAGSITASVLAADGIVRANNARDAANLANKVAAQADLAATAAAAAAASANTAATTACKTVSPAGNCP